MRNPHLKCLTILAALLCAAAPAAAQQQLNENISVGGVNRSYIVYLPVNFSPAENMPAMFFFHGGGGTANQGIFECDFRSLANSERFIVVYPQAINSTSGTNSWDCLGDYHGGIDEMGFVSVMIDALADNYNIDTQRVYAGGYSLGGSIVYDIAAYLPDQVAAIAPVAANMWEWTLSDVNWSTSVACVHLLGTNDFYAPYGGNDYSISTDAQNSHFVSLNGAETDPLVENLGGNITRYTWAPGDGCHGHQHYRRQGGGHDAPSGYPQGPQWIWDFVSQYSLDGVPGCNDADCPGDITGDAAVGVNDLLAVIAAWGSSDGDADGNGTTNVDDLLIVIGNWNATCS
ncbi:MAG: hypothetical protein CMJ24_07020 [Phycisphaerae bacterium]|nr:hypothetical protein [Phycisphaerae bacterium]